MKRLPATRTLTVALLGALLAVGSIAPARASHRVGVLVVPPRR